MKAAIHRAHGGSEVLVVEDVPQPVLEPHEVLVAVEACGVNHLDVLQRRGPPLLPGFRLPHIAGMDVAGSIVEIGGAAVTSPGGSPWSIGDRVVVNPAIACGVCARCLAGDDGMCPNSAVVGGSRPGGYAEFVSVSSAHVHRIPDSFTYVEAAAIPTVWVTAWHALVTVGEVRVGETVLVHAAASGVSTAAIQIAKRAGATVIATGSSEAKLAYAKALGADHTVDSSDGDTAGSVRELTAGRGVDLVVDHVGPAVWAASLYSLAPRGRLVFLGNTTGNDAAIDLPYCYHFGIRLLGSDPYPAREFAEVLERYWHGGFETPIDSEHDLADARGAQHRLESRLALGKVILHP